MNNPLISIISPIYKAESYLDRLINSVLNQTYPYFELILVDDGSPDRSGEICDAFAAKESRIKVIHKENGGVSSARQAGLIACTGDFVIHADSDDWLAPNMLEELVKHYKKTDAELVIFDFYLVTNGVVRYVKQQPTSLDNKQVLKDIIGGKVYASCWNKLIKKSIIDNYGVSFPNGINFGEDKCFLASLLKNHIKVSYLSLPLYYYDTSINIGSLVRQISMASIENGFAMVDYLEQELDDDFTDSIFEVKRRLKIRAIESGFYSDIECRNIYKDINKQLITNVLTLKVHMKEDLMLFFHTLGLFRLSKLIKYR